MFIQRFQIFEMYNTKFFLTRLEHYKGPYEKNEPYVVRSRYKWTNGVYVSIWNKMYDVTGTHILTQHCYMYDEAT